MDSQPRADTAAGEDPAAVARPAGLRRRRFGVRTMITTAVSGFLMGSADIVPGVSGGTVALVLGIYERLVANIRQGARAASLLVRGQIRTALRALGLVEWTFLGPLLLGILAAVVSLASALEHLLEREPTMMSAAFFGLIVGSVVVSYTEIRERRWDVHLVLVVSAIATFLLLGLRSGRFEDPTLVIVFLGGMLAICAMILPGISGSFILLIIGLYQVVLGAVNDRDLVLVTVFGLGAVVGLGSFATLLNWLLRRFHSIVLAALVGLMLGSLRVLWPWPAGADGVGDTRLGPPVAAELLPAVGLALAGVVAVVVVALAARALSEADDPDPGAA